MGAFVGAFGFSDGSATVAASTLPLVAAALALVLLAGAGAFVFSRAGSLGAGGAVAGADVAQAVSASSTARVETAREGELRTNAAAPPIAALTSPPAPTVRMRGRVVRSTGEPLAGAAVRLRARIGTPLESFFYLRGETTSDALGAFDVAIATTRGGALELDVLAVEFARRRATWNRVEPGALVEAGEVVLAPIAGVEVVLRDTHGDALANGWTVRADPPFDARTPGASWLPLATPPCDVAENVGAVASTATGDRFVLDSLAVGRFAVSATHRTGFQSNRATIETNASATTRVELVYDGPDPERCITVRAWGGREHVAEFDLAAFTLRDANGGTRAATAGPSGSALFPELEPGAYVVEIHDARFAPWQSEAVPPGTGVTADLRGLAELELHVRRRPGGDEVEDYELGQDSDHGRVDLMKRYGDPIPAGRIYDLAPGTHALAVSDGGERTLRIAVNDLLPGEHRVLDVAFERATRLTGRVVEADGTTPVVGARVVLQNPWSPSHPKPASRYRRMGENDEDGPILATTHTDANGAFDFSGAVPGERIVRVEAGPRRIVRDLHVVVVEDDQPNELLFTLPAGGAIRGRVVVPPNANTSRYRVELAVADAYEPNASERDPVLAATGTVGLEADESFAFTHVPPGRYELHVAMPQASARPSSFRSAPSLLLGFVEVAGTETVEPVFDVSTTLPGEITVQVVAHGLPLRDASVGAIGGDLTRTNSPCWARTDADGRATITSIAPGIRSIVVQHERRRWVFASNETRMLEPGGSAAFTIDVPLAVGTIECVEASTNALLANLQVWWIVGEPGDAMHGSGVTLDDLGRARIEAPPGPYALARIDANITDTARRAEITWPPPGETVLTVPLH